MLIKVASRFFQTNTGDTVTVAAVARDNNGFEGATFQYAGAPRQGPQVQNHPACQFIVTHGVNTFASLLLFDTGAANAVYDLFEVDGAGNLLPLVDAPTSAGRITQFQIDGLPVASLAAAALAEASAGAPIAAPNLRPPQHTPVTTARAAKAGARARPTTVRAKKGGAKKARRSGRTSK